MLFNSFAFLVFFVLVFFIYWFACRGNRKLQNLFLLGVSYIFYGWWDWRFLFLLLLSTVIDYSFGLIIHNSEKRKKFYLWLSILNNLGVLFFFKYYNFFADSAQEFLDLFGLSMNPVLINIVLPVGISFYTFHGMSYVIDIYNGKFKPVKNFVDYSLFVSFFPLLVAGPIERATHLLPQIVSDRKFSYKQAVEGVQLIIWGLFKKAVIADNCAIYVNNVFADYGSASGFELIMGVLFFAFQIYGDFSGYSDIAIGTAKILGIELLVNFRTPYFARDIAEFWRRWHISLTTWFRDYVYIPLGGSKTGNSAAVRNTLIVFLISGFWHGANWTFIVWGALNAIYFVPLLLTGKNRKNLDNVAENSSLPTIRELGQMAMTFFLVCISWVFFRAPSVKDALSYFQKIFENDFIRGTGIVNIDFLTVIGLLFIFILAEWTIRVEGVNGIMNSIRRRPVKYAVYYFFLVCIFLFGAFREAEFIYFQF